MSIDTTLTIYSSELLSQIQTNTSSDDLSALAKVLSKASKKASSGLKGKDVTDNHIARLLQCPEAHLHAKASLYLHGIHSDNASWVCFASPVKMQPNRDHMVISQTDDFDFTDSEGKSLTCELNDYFCDDDIHFIYQAPGYWICVCENIHDITRYSPQEIFGENIMPYLPVSKEDIQWRKIFNEVQMLLHHSVTNQQRIAQGKRDINSFWFWGGGVLPATYQSPYSQILTDDPQLSGLSALGGATVLPIDHLSEQVGEHIKENTNTLIILNKCQCKKINSYLINALQLLDNKRIDSLVIVPSYTHEFNLTRKDLKKFWRRTKDISFFIQSDNL